MLGATALLYGVTRRMFGRRAALFAAGLFAGTGSVQFLGALATYDAMALFLLALATWLGVRAVATQSAARYLLDRPGDLGGSDSWEDAEPRQHSGSIPRSCVSAR